MVTQKNAFMSNEETPNKAAHLGSTLGFDTRPWNDGVPFSVLVYCPFKSLSAGFCYSVTPVSFSPWRKGCKQMRWKARPPCGKYICDRHDLCQVRLFFIYEHSVIGERALVMLTGRRSSVFCSMKRIKAALLNRFHIHCLSC